MISLALHTVPEKNGLGSYVKFAPGKVTHTKDLYDPGIIFYYSATASDGSGFGGMVGSKLVGFELMPHATRPGLITHALVITMIKNGAGLDDLESDYIIDLLYKGSRSDVPSS